MDGRRATLSPDCPGPDQPIVQSFLHHLSGSSIFAA
jgi:hypothetical protein